MNLNGTEYFYVRNAQGDIIGLIDKAGTQVVSYNYDSWGKMTPSKAEIDDASDTNKNGITGTLKDTVGVKNPYRYRGYRYDTETELYYLQSRYYNPEWGRFINADALGGVVGELLSHNVFAYCKNNPIIAKDPSGFRPVYTMDEETDDMRSASYERMNGASASEVANKYKSKGSALSSSVSSFASGAIDQFYSSIAAGAFKDISREIIEGTADVFGYGFEMLHLTFNKGAKLARGVVGAGGTIIFFLDSVNSTQAKYGKGWDKSGKRILVDGIATVASFAVGAAIAPAAALPAIAVGAAVGIFFEVGARTFKSTAFGDDFWD